jgi:hypothetical protein
MSCSGGGPPRARASRPSCRAWCSCACAPRRYPADRPPAWPPRTGRRRTRLVPGRPEAGQPGSLPLLPGRTRRLAEAAVPQRPGGNGQLWVLLARSAAARRPSWIQRCTWMASARHRGRELGSLQIPGLIQLAVVRSGEDPGALGEKISAARRDAGYLSDGGFMLSAGTRPTLTAAAAPLEYASQRHIVRASPTLPAGNEGSIQRLSARPLRRLRYQRTSVPDGKSSTQPTSS